MPHFCTYKTVTSDIGKIHAFPKFRLEYRKDATPYNDCIFGFSIPKSIKMESNIITI